MHRFFVYNINESENNITISDSEDVKHIFKVLRLNPGEKIEICDGQNSEYLCEIQSTSKKEITASIINKIPSKRESDINVDLYQGLPKSAKMDSIIQKCTELGIKSITPLITNRCVSQIKDEKSERKKIERWEKIALSAAKQSKRGIIPSVNNALKFKEALNKFKEYDLVIVAYENEQTRGLKEVLRNSNYKNCAIIIGPEGGLEIEEVSSIEEIGGLSISLGPRILRTETAGFTALSIIMYEIGDIGGR